MRRGLPLDAVSQSATGELPATMKEPSWKSRVDHLPAPSSNGMTELGTGYSSACSKTRNQCPILSVSSLTLAYRQPVAAYGRRRDTAWDRTMCLATGISV